ncbi:MAG: hypothetical protein AMXMBFR59_41090 [Rhodanobacteraceae bacterium]
MICKTCGTAGETKGAVKGSTGVELVLWILAVTVIGFPFALVYSVWRGSTKHKVCRACRSADLIPVGTPIGQQLCAAAQRRA